MSEETIEHGLALGSRPPEPFHGRYKRLTREVKNIGRHLGLGKQQSTRSIDCAIVDCVGV